MKHLSEHYLKKVVYITLFGERGAKLKDISYNGIEYTSKLKCVLCT